MSRQARPQLSKSWSEAKGTCESARSPTRWEYPICRFCSRRGEAFEYARRRIAPPIFLGCAAVRGALSSPPYASPVGEAFEYTRSCIAPPFSSGVLREGADLLFRVYMDHSFSGDETNQDCRYGFLVVLRFCFWDSF